MTSLNVECGTLGGSLEFQRNLSDKNVKHASKLTESTHLAYFLNAGEYMTMFLLRLSAHAHWIAAASRTWMLSQPYYTYLYGIGWFIMVKRANSIVVTLTQKIEQPRATNRQIFDKIWHRPRYLIYLFVTWREISLRSLCKGILQYSPYECQMIMKITLKTTDSKGDTCIYPGYRVWYTLIFHTTAPKQGKMIKGYNFTTIIIVSCKLVLVSRPNSMGD